MYKGVREKGLSCAYVLFKGELILGFLKWMLRSLKGNFKAKSTKRFFLSY